MKKIFLILPLALSSVAATAQIRIEGVLKDSLSNAAEPYATVRVYRADDREGKPIGMSLTGKNGEIRQNIEENGDFLLTISSVGKKDVRRRITVSGETVIKLGDILTCDDTHTLGSVQVVAQKPIVKMETGKITYNVMEDIDSKSFSVFDMLRKVPMVIIDAQDNIIVNNSSSFKILVDGKPNMQLQNNTMQLLKAAPASIVESIEVITHPGAKYDAEGVGGVLNLIMRHDNGGQMTDSKGCNGEVRAGLNTRGDIDGSANITGQSKKFNYNFTAYGSISHTKDCVLDDERHQYNSSTSLVTSHRLLDEYNKNAGMALSLGYNLDSLNVLNASVGINCFTYKGEGPVSMALSNTALSGGDVRYSYDGTQKYYFFGVIADADWQHFFNHDRLHSLTLSYQFCHRPTHDENYMYYHDSATLMGLSDSYSDGHPKQTEHTVQADYTYPMGKRQALNAGAKFIAHDSHAESNYYLLGKDGGYEETSFTSTYDDHQRILAGYVEHDGSYGKWNTREGIRYEHTWESIDYPQQYWQNFKKNYGDIVPSFLASYRFSDKDNIGLTYQMRIKRPSLFYMNPYRDPSDPTAVTYGNPDLEVENAHFIDLEFCHYGNRFMFTAKLSQCFCNNQIDRYSFTDDTGRLNTTYDNSTRNRWTNFNTWMRFVLGKNTSVSFDGYLGYGDMRCEQRQEHNSGWQADCSLNLEQQLPWKIMWNLSVSSQTKRYNLQGYSSGYSYAFTTFYRSFCKDRLDVSISAETPFTGKLKYTSYRHTVQFDDTLKGSIPVNNIKLTIAWKFGNMNEQFGQHQSRISSEYKEGNSQGSGLR